MFSQEDFVRLKMSNRDSGDFQVGDTVYNLRVSRASTSRFDRQGQSIWITVRTVTRSDALIPEFAIDENGDPYTGALTGAIEPNFDWSGSFVEGRPHGAFWSSWLGFRPGPNWLFEHGRSVSLPEEKK